MRRTTLGIVGAVCITSIASAADLPKKAPVQAPAPVYSWTGFYIGGHVGAYGRGATGGLIRFLMCPFSGYFRSPEI
jgi:outer membrane immunogenic protein